MTDTTGPSIINGRIRRAPNPAACLDVLISTTTPHLREVCGLNGLDPDGDRPDLITRIRDHLWPPYLTPAGPPPAKDYRQGLDHTGPSLDEVTSLYLSQHESPA